jgi:hypothetical protein
VNKQRSYIREVAIGNRRRYCCNKEHPHHINKKVHPVILNLVASEDLFEELLKEYWKELVAAAKGKRGRPPKNILSEVIYRCPKGAYLTPNERQQMYEALLAVASRGCASLGYWHEHNDGTWDLHLLLANVTFTKPLGLRLKGTGHGEMNYIDKMHTAENEALERINRIRIRSRIRKVESVPEAQERRAAAKGIKLLPVELAELNVGVTEENLVALIESLGHEASIKEARALIKFKTSTFTLRYNLKRLLTRANDARRDRAMRIQKDLQQLRAPRSR